MSRLNVNIDHVATLRQARGGKEPDPLTAALICEIAGAEGIVCHLREDRRHASDRDVYAIKEAIQTKFDLEMAANEEIINIALDVVPDLVTIVPEKRMELTTEGGLDVASNISKYKILSSRMHSKGIKVSYFVEPSINQIQAVIDADGDMVELHTGNFANLFPKENYQDELKKIERASEFAKSNKILVAAGHGLNYTNIKQIAQNVQIDEFSIGHSIIAKAVFVGLENAVREMIYLINFSKGQ